MTTSGVIGMTMSGVKAAKRRVTSEPNYSPASMPATVYRPIAQQALKLTGAEITLVAVAVNHDIPPSEVADLIIVETAGAAMTSVPAHAIPLAGASIWQAFVERTPRRLNNFDVAIDGVQHAGPALVLPLRTTDTVVGVLVALRRDGARDVRRRATRHDGCIHRPGGTRLAAGVHPAPDARTQHSRSPRQDRPRVAPPRDPADLRGRTNSAGNHSAGAIS